MENVLNELTECARWKNQCFESETKDLFEWQEALQSPNLFEVGSYCGAKINELVNKYGYDYVVRKFDEAKESKKTTELESNGMKRCQ